STAFLGKRRAIDEAARAFSVSDGSGPNPASSGDAFAARPGEGGLASATGGPWPAFGLLRPRPAQARGCARESGGDAFLPPAVRAAASPVLGHFPLPLSSSTIVWISGWCTWSGSPAGSSSTVSPR